MYFDTVDWATLKPSINSSPWIREAPHSGLSWLIRRIRSLRPRSIFGRPAPFCDLQVRNPIRYQRKTVSGFTTRTERARSGQNRTKPTKTARSTPRDRNRRGAYLKATLSWWRRSRFSASSRLRDFNRSMTKLAKAQRTENIAGYDATIRSQQANP